jgi:hypothetical protein
MVVSMFVGVRLTVGPPVAAGAALRMEGCLQGAHGRAEAPEHVLDHVIRADAQPPRPDLRGQVPVPEVPGQARERARVLRVDLEERLVGAGHAHEATVVEFRGVPLGEARHLRQVQEEGEAALPRAHEPPSMAMLEVQAPEASASSICCGQT